MALHRGRIGRASDRGHRLRADRADLSAASDSPSSCRAGSNRGLDAAFAIGLAAAVPAFAATFRGPRDRFWGRMTATGLVLGGLALVANPALRRTRIGPREVVGAGLRRRPLCHVQGRR